MKINIRAKPGNNKEYIKQITSTQFVVAVKEIAEKGRANQAIIKSLANYFDIAPTSLKIVSGKFSKQKIIQIPDFKQLQFWQEQEA